MPWSRWALCLTIGKHVRASVKHETQHFILTNHCMSNLPAKSEPESNEHLLRHSLGIVDGDSFEDETLETFDAEQMLHELLSDPNVYQHVTRRSCDGEDSITGYFRCQFEPSQERTILHVPIHPPMSAVPKVNASFVQPEDAKRIRVTDRQKFGTRLEIIRSTDHDQPCQVMVEVILTASSERPVE